MQPGDFKQAAGTRYDVSNVPLQGGYVAKQCPVRAQNDTLKRGEPIPPDEFMERLYANGNTFEAKVIEEILGSHPEAVVVERPGSDALEDATLLAMDDGSSPILSARLPADLSGRRVGRPDLLLAADTGGYRPVDIKWHQTLEPEADRASAIPGLCASLSAPTLESALLDSDYAARKKQEDLLQLAHYQRMLEAAGMAAKDGPLGRDHRH